eukprot:scaffold7343_cov230-Pinguiococcus_pyrenoidosus.AAC.3
MNHRITNNEQWNQDNRVDAKSNWKLETGKLWKVPEFAMNWMVNRLLAPTASPTAAITTLRV